MDRKKLNDLPGSKIVNRDKNVNEIADIIKQVCETARHIRLGKSSPSSVPGRLIVLKGGVGTGKSVLLETLERDLPTQSPSCRVTHIINIHEVIEVILNGWTLSSALIECSGKLNPGNGDAATQSKAMVNVLKSQDIPIIVLLDDLESLNNPLLNVGDSERDDRVRDVKNLLLRPLLQLIDVPAIIIAAMRATPDAPLPYLSEIDFQDALPLHDIVIENTDEDVRKVLGDTASDDQVEDCAGSLLMADQRDPVAWYNKLVIEGLIDEMMAREPISPIDQRTEFKRLLAALSELTMPTNMTVIKENAEALNLPADLQWRITARLVASSHLVNNGASYQVYRPLANLFKARRSQELL